MSSCHKPKSAKAFVTIGYLIVFITIIFTSVAAAADVTLAWDANTEPDLAGYVVYYGTASRDYAQRIDVGNTVSHTITGLNEGQTYYFAATAYDANGNESAYSLELSHQVGAPPSPLDSDGDTLSDEDESNLYGTNPNMADTDGDGLSDGVEVKTYQTNPLAADSDADGLSDGAELNTYGTNPRNADSDGDGLSDGAEVSTYQTNPLAADSDADGLSDGAELNTYGTNPRNADSDGDGLSDGAEVSTYQTNPLVADTDADGIGDGEEIAGGTNPLIDDSLPNNPPFTPVLVLPNDNETDVSFTPVLVAEEFADPDKQDTHARTQWQISTDVGFSYLVFDLVSDRFLTTLPLHDAILSRNTTYYWRVRFMDSRTLASEWSDPFVFITSVDSTEDQNLDGIPDSQEVTGVTDLDENKVPDAEQLDLVCLNTIVSGVPIGMKWSANVNAVEALISSDGTEISETLNKPTRLPYGLISFKVSVENPGDTIEITFMSAEAFPENLRWFKYDLDNGWYDYSPHVEFSVNAKKIVLTLTDGGDGDADGVANGIIVDPSAVTTSDATSGSSSYLRDTGGDEPAPSKASCFIAATADTDLSRLTASGPKQFISVRSAIVCLLIGLIGGIMQRRHRKYDVR